MTSAAIQILRIQEEYNSTFEAVVRSYAEAGTGMTETAEELGIRPASFTKILLEMGWRPWFKPMRSYNKYHLYKGQVDTVKGHALRHGIAYSTAHVNIRKEEALSAKRDAQSFTLDGIKGTVREHCERLLLPPGKVRTLISREAMKRRDGIPKASQRGGTTGRYLR